MENNELYKQEHLLEPEQENRPAPQESMTLPNGNRRINGIELPVWVTEEIRNLGIPLMFLTEGELKAAKSASIDGVVIEDPLGTSFYDMLSLTYEEESEQADAAASRFGAGWLFDRKQENAPPTVYDSRLCAVSTAHNPYIQRDMLTEMLCGGQERIPKPSQHALLF